MHNSAIKILPLRVIDRASSICAKTSVFSLNRIFHGNTQFSLGIISKRVRNINILYKKNILDDWVTLILIFYFLHFYAASLVLNFSLGNCHRFPLTRHSRVLPGNFPRTRPTSLQTRSEFVLPHNSKIKIPPRTIHCSYCGKFVRRGRVYVFLALSLTW